MNRPLFLFIVGENTFTAECICADLSEPVWHFKYNRVTVKTSDYEPDVDNFIAFVQNCLKQIG